MKLAIDIIVLTLMVPVYVWPFYKVYKGGDFRKGVLLGWLLLIGYCVVVSTVLFELVWLYSPELTENIPEGNEIVGALAIGWLYGLVVAGLAVLSACETGLGDVHAGEGVFGLRRAFVLAGAKTLLMSLWKVPDWETQQLMVDLYRRILAGQPRSAALRDAQLALKDNHPDPLYWAAFICQGDPGPLA